MQKLHCLTWIQGRKCRNTTSRVYPSYKVYISLPNKNPQPSSQKKKKSLYPRMGNSAGAEDISHLKNCMV
jgi:hypothetical protein